MNFSVTQNGQDLSKEKYNWDESTKTFSTNENFLTLDFSEIDGAIIKTGSNCLVKISNTCKIKSSPFTVLEVYDLVSRNRVDVFGNDVFKFFL